MSKKYALDEACADAGIDAATLEDVPNNSVDLVVTSPPYGDSRTTVAYGEYSRLSLQWLNLYELSEKDIMGIDKTLMGGNKFRNGFEFTISSNTLRTSLERIKDVDLERAGDVYSFYFCLCINKLVLIFLFKCFFKLFSCPVRIFFFIFRNC